MTIRPATRGLHRCRGAQRREGPLGAEAFGVVAGGDEELAGCLVADAVASDEFGGDRVDDLLGFRSELLGFVVEEPPAAGNAAQRSSCHRTDVTAGAGAEPLSERNLLLERQCRQLAAQLVGGGVEQRVQLVRRRGARLDGTSACNT